MCNGTAFLCTTPSVAQETTPFLTQIRNLTPKQQFNYVIEARKRGYSLLQLEGLAKAQGATLEDLSLLRTAWSDSQTGGVGEGLEENLQDEGTRSFGNESQMFDFFEEEEESDIFGSSFFANKNISETPQFYVATPAGYRLGPSDEITIDVWGASENRYEVTLSRQGVVRIDRLKPIYLSGLTLAAAERKIRNEFSSIYTGLSPDSPNESKVYLDVNLQKARKYRGEYHRKRRSSRNLYDIWIFVCLKRALCGRRPNGKRKLSGDFDFTERKRGHHDRFI